MLQDVVVGEVFKMSNPKPSRSVSCFHVRNCGTRTTHITLHSLSSRVTGLLQVIERSAGVGLDEKALDNVSQATGKVLRMLGQQGKIVFPMLHISLLAL